MDMKEEFERARDFVSTLNFQKDYSVSFFETTIRYLGGFLSAFTLSDDPVFLRKAVELADALLPAFDTPTGIAMHGVNVLTYELYLLPRWLIANTLMILSPVAKLRTQGTPEKAQFWPRQEQSSSSSST